MDEDKTITFEELETRTVELHDRVRLAPRIDDLNSGDVQDFNHHYAVWSRWKREEADRQELDLRVGDVIVGNYRYQVTHVFPLSGVIRRRQPDVESKVYFKRILKSGKLTESGQDYSSYSRIRDHYHVERTGMKSRVAERIERENEAFRRKAAINDATATTQS